MPDRRGSLAATPSQSWVAKAGDWVAFPGLLAASVAALLLLAASHALGVPPNWVTASLAAAGTLVVYNVDRLRDLRADRATAPLRTAFIEQHRTGLRALTGAAAIVSIALGLQAGRDVQLLCAAILGVGLLHRRLKQLRDWKATYVTAAWVSVTVGIPAIESRDSESLPWVFTIYTATIGANLLATRLRAAADPIVLWAARGLALAAVVAASLAPSPAQPLGAIAACELLALATFRPGERYGHIAVDGALLAGAILALALATA